jgi:quercetin dioxygenase-like cupin family protein
MNKASNRTVVNPIYKDRVTFLETSKETSGRHTLLELSLQPGGKDTPHIHTAFTETFIPIKGILGLQLDEERILMNPGHSYTVLQHEVHHFFNPYDEEIIFRIKFTPGHEGIENAMRIAYGLARDARTNKKGIPKSIYESALLMEMSNSYPSGIASVIKPMLSLLARRARKKGIERSLLDRYCP